MRLRQRCPAPSSGVLCASLPINSLHTQGNAAVGRGQLPGKELWAIDDNEANEWVKEWEQATSDLIKSLTYSLHKRDLWDTRPGRRMPLRLFYIPLAGFDRAPVADSGRRLREHRAGLEQARVDLGEAALIAWKSGASLNKIATAAGVTPEVIATATMKAHRKREGIEVLPTHVANA